MGNNFPVIRQSADAILSKTKNLMSIGNKILAKKSELSQSDDSWIERLWEWADKSNIPDLEWYVEYDDTGYWRGLPRNKEKLLLLTELTLDWDNLITELPQEIGNLVNLKSLDIQSTSLTKLPQEIGKLINLELLDLKNNNLNELPKEIGKLVKLKHLFLWGNNLTALPKEIGNLVHLEWLNLQQNSLTTIPKEIGNLTNLKWLLLEDNGLIDLPQEITNLVYLERIDLENNVKISITQEQMNWLSALITSGSVVRIDNDTFLDEARAIRNKNSIDYSEEIPF